MFRNNEFPEIPESMAGKEVKIQYISPISGAQKQTEAEGFSNAMNYLGPIIQANPSLMRLFDLDFVVRDTEKLFSYSAKYLKSSERVQKEDQAAQQAAAEQQQAQKANEALELAGKAKEVDGKAEAIA